MPIYKTPGVYIEEIAALPPSVAEVETAVPAFVGYTQKARSAADSDLRNQPVRITSFEDFEQIFGQAYPDELSVEVVRGRRSGFKHSVGLHDPGYILWHCIKLFFDNGGVDCYVVSVGGYSGIPEFSTARLRQGLDAIRTEDEPTLIVIPEMVHLDEPGFSEISQAMLQQCGELGDRFAILDIRGGETDPDDVDWPRQRALFGTRYLEYGAAYFPFLTKSGYLGGVEDDKVIVRYRSSRRRSSTLPLSKWREVNEELFNAVKRELNRKTINLPPSAAMAGIYAATDNNRGVWKAPANISVSSIKKPAVDISHAQQEPMNVDPASGKSINAIRFFTGKGTLVWGARTLAGNDNEWRYIPVRRFAIMIEESLYKSSQWAVFEPNDVNTWTRVKAMIANYLTEKWRDGALAGAKPEDAFFVSCGLGNTMTQQDILEGRLIVELGLAVVRPAEFIVLRLELKVQTS